MHSMHVAIWRRKVKLERRKALTGEVEVSPAAQKWIDFEEVKEEGKTFWTRLFYTF